MKQRQCWYCCDVCGDESPHAVSYLEARRLATKEGWLIEPGNEGWHYCQKCPKAVVS